MFNTRAEMPFSFSRSWALIAWITLAPVAMIATSEPSLMRTARPTSNSSA